MSPVISSWTGGSVSPPPSRLLRFKTAGDAGDWKWSALAWSIRDEVEDNECSAISRRGDRFRFPFEAVITLNLLTFPTVVIDAIFVVWRVIGLLLLVLIINFVLNMGLEGSRLDDVISSLVLDPLMWKTTTGSGATKGAGCCSLLGMTNDAIACDPLQVLLLLVVELIRWGSLLGMTRVAV